MSYINFESSRVKDIEREKKRKARDEILKKAEADYNKRKEREENARLRGDDKWILPSVEERLKKESKKEKKHKHKKKKKRKKSKQQKSSSSDSEGESTSEDEWVEKASDTVPKESHKNKIADNKEEGNLVHERDEWMTLPGLFPTTTREQLKQQSGRLSKAEEEREKNKYMLDKLGQSDRELNPYWKDGGTGLPQEKDNAKENTLTLSGKAVGDHGVDWLRRALKRTQQQAEEEGRTVEDVAAERWGSLKKLETLLAEAEEKSKKEKRKRNYDREMHEDCSEHWRRNKEYDNKRHDKYSYRDTGRERDRKDRYGESSRSFMRPKTDDGSEIGSDLSKFFQKPKDGDNVSRSKFQKPGEGGASLSSFRNSSSSGNWRKKLPEKSSNEVALSDRKDKSYKKGSRPSSSSSSDSDLEEEKKKSVEKQVPTTLTDKEMNELGAKLVKAEILGNKELANDLRSRLEAARLMRTTKPAEVKEPEHAEVETVILTKMDSKGFVHPLQQTEHVEPSGGRRKKQKVETHKDGKRMRYFADDDKYSLQDLFQREKLCTVQDQNEMFSKLAGRDKQDDMDDIFEDHARFKERSGKAQARERSEAISEYKKVDKVLEKCNWCFDSKEMLKHLVAAIGTKVYLCLPPHQSLVEGHCLIIPMYHMPCATQLDEDVWSEVQIFKKTITTMFQKLDQDVVFFESAMYLNKYPHMMIECVPMAREIGDMAPIYFKKAILECETEWSNNKKLVDLKGKDVRRAVPKGLPYFTVDFGVDPGFAHVIEDEKMFPRNFAQEIIGGMLDLDHSAWRKPRRENFDAQRKKILQFAKWWKPYDFTVKKDTSSSDSDSD